MGANANFLVAALAYHGRDMIDNIEESSSKKNPSHAKMPGVKMDTDNTVI